MADARVRFDEMLERAKDDEDILAFWLDGSRGKGRAGEHSDYDCTLVVKPSVLEDYRRRFEEVGRSGLDVAVLTLAEFEVLAAWNSPHRWRRYNYAHLAPLVDKTGRIQALFDDKARVPPDAVAAFVRGSIDHVVNQIYRALKCVRDGDAPAAQLEAAEAVGPAIDAIFAVNGGRLRPYYKYLRWELETHPLEHSLWDANEFIDRLVGLGAAPVDPPRLRTFVARFEERMRSLGYGEVFDNWGDALRWILGTPAPAPGPRSPRRSA